MIELTSVPIVPADVAAKLLGKSRRTFLREVDKGLWNDALAQSSERRFKLPVVAEKRGQPITRDEVIAVQAELASERATAHQRYLDRRIAEAFKQAA